jgi:hypothetical protein
MEIKLKDLIDDLGKIRVQNNLTKEEDIVENIPLDSLWKKVSTLFLDKIKLMKRRGKRLDFTTDLNELDQEKILSLIIHIIEHGDVRVYEKVCVFSEELMQILPTNIVLHTFFQLFSQGIKNNLERKITQRPVLLGHDMDDSPEQMIDIDDVTGWRRLESFLHLFHSILMGILLRNDSSFFNVLDLLRSSLSAASSGVDLECFDWYDIMIASMACHPNRHFRELTFNFISRFADNVLSPSLSSGLTYLESSEWETEKSNRDNYFSLFHAFLSLIPSGLEDDWSQIRYSASKAFHSIANSLLSISIEVSHRFYEENIGRMVPRICLNRFHPAKSISTLSLETWQKHFGKEGIGRELILTHFDEVTDYYVLSTKHKNHMICEAACHAIGEIILKLKNFKITEKASLFLATIESSLGDNRWPVYDASLIPSSQILRFYFSTKNEDILICERFYPIWSQRLHDSIWSIRENAAMAFGEMMMISTNQQIVENVANYCFQYLSSYFLFVFQKKTASIASDFNNSSATLTVKTSKITSFLPEAMLKKKSTGSSSALVGSLGNDSSAGAPDRSKLKKGWGCCIDCAELRPSQEWEYSHGCLYLLREMIRAFSLSFVLNHPISFVPYEKDTPTNMTLLDSLVMLMESKEYEHYDKLWSAIYQEVRLLLTKLLCALSFDFFLDSCYDGCYF